MQDTRLTTVWLILIIALQIGFIPETMQADISSPALTGGNSPVAADELSLSARILSNRKKGARYRSKPGYKSYNRERMRKWRNSHPHYSRDHMRKARLLNPDEVRRKKREYRRRNLSKVRKAGRSWYRNHAHVRLAINHKRRAQQRCGLIQTTQIKEFIERIRTRKMVKCYYCQSPISGASAHLDHIVALSKGGSHTISNLCATCATCNLSKYNHAIGPWQPATSQAVLPL